MMICVDASFIIRMLTNQQSESIYEQRWNQWQQSNNVIVAPTLLMYEVCNGIYRYSKIGQITNEEAEQLIEQALNLRIQYYGDAELHRQAFSIAQRDHLSATYDAHYLALAERLKIEFWTSDQRLFNSIHSNLPWINLLA